MVQSEAEIIKMTTLFNKVLYKWLDGSPFMGFRLTLKLLT